MRDLILAIDPGTTESGVCVVNSQTYSPLVAEKVSNEDIFMLPIDPKLEEVVIEMVASYGMPVGREVFETCVYIGRFAQHFKSLGVNVSYIYRQEEKLTICHSPKANDASIKAALIDRFAYGVSNYGKGTKDNKGFFYGFKADVWSAFAIAVTYIDKVKNGKAIS